ncbi:hypothetical protein RB595_003397 [Gaeumannomyces hyphopodioides]
MHCVGVAKAARFLLLLGLWMHFASGLGWRSSQRPPTKQVTNGVWVAPSVGFPSPESTEKRLHLPDVYVTALRELQELESEPLCHRIAARLLVTNCQLLDGKDEATVLTDSGRQVRDFVEAYAASLALCDLERGGFKIPPACSPFREPVLSRISIQEDAGLHVSSSQIQTCISSLRSPDSAWGTYISYRHKALQFCEAARADQEKSRNILVFQKLIKVTERLVRGVEIDLQARMDDLDLRTNKASQVLDQLNPKLDSLRDGLRDMQMNQEGLKHTLQSSAALVRGGLEDATSLQQLLKVIVDAALDQNSQLAAAHEQSISRVARVYSATEEATNQVDLLVSVMTTAAASSMSLHRQLEISRVQASQLAERQDTIETGLIRLANLTEDLASKYENHTNSIQSVHNLTQNLVGTLTDANTMASNAKNALLSWTSNWLPYALYPVVFVLGGSYGLPPSIFRNLWLAALSEGVAVTVSSWDAWVNYCLSFAGAGNAT